MTKTLTHSEIMNVNRQGDFCFDCQNQELLCCSIKDQTAYSYSAAEEEQTTINGFWGDSIIQYYGLIKDTKDSKMIILCVWLPGYHPEALVCQGSYFEEEKCLKCDCNNQSVGECQRIFICFCFRSFLCLGISSKGFYCFCLAAWLPG